MQKTQIIKSWQKKKIKKIKKSLTNGLSSDDINSLLNHVFNFVGVFPQNGLRYIKYVKIPFSLIVNTDNDSKPGLHWIAIFVTKKKVEICDSFGFKPNKWSDYPIHISLFLARFLHKRRLVISPQIQSESSKLCGFYAILFILFRQNLTFRQFLNQFSSNFRANDRLVYSYFS